MILLRKSGRKQTCILATLNQYVASIYILLRLLDMSYIQIHIYGLKIIPYLIHVTLVLDLVIPL